MRRTASRCMKSGSEMNSPSATSTAMLTSVRTPRTVAPLRAHHLIGGHPRTPGQAPNSCLLQQRPEGQPTDRDVDDPEHAEELDPGPRLGWDAVERRLPGPGRTEHDGRHDG